MLVQNKLLQMQGKSYYYMGNVHKIINSKIIDETLHIVTNRSWLEFNIDKAEDILARDFLETAEEQNGNGKSLKIFQEVKDANITAILVDNIRKLGDGTLAPKTAAAVNQTTNTILNIIKTDLQLNRVKGK